MTVATRKMQDRRVGIDVGRPSQRVHDVVTANVLNPRSPCEVATGSRNLTPLRESLRVASIGALIRTLFRVFDLRSPFKSRCRCVSSGAPGSAASCRLRSPLGASIRCYRTPVSGPLASISLWNWGMLLTGWFGCRRVVSFVQWRWLGSSSSRLCQPFGCRLFNGVDYRPDQLTSHLEPLLHPDPTSAPTP